MDPITWAVVLQVVLGAGLVPFPELVPDADWM